MPGLHHGRARLTDADLSPGALCHAHYVDLMYKPSPLETVRYAMRKWPDAAEVALTAAEVLATEFAAPEGVHLRPLLDRDERGVADLVRYVLGQEDENAAHLADFPWRVESYAAYRAAVAERPVCLLFHRGDGLAHTARRVRDLTAVIRGSRASVDKIHHVVETEDGISQHVPGNLQILDGVANQGKGSLQTAIEMDLYMFVAVVLNVFRPALTANRLAEVLAAAGSLVRRVTPASRELVALGSLGQTRLRAAAAGAALLAPEEDLSSEDGTASGADTDDAAKEGAADSQGTSNSSGDSDGDNELAAPAVDEHNSGGNPFVVLGLNRHTTNEEVAGKCQASAEPGLKHLEGGGIKTAAACIWALHTNAMETMTAAEIGIYCLLVGVSAFLVHFELLR